VLGPLAQDLAEWRLHVGHPDAAALVFPGHDGEPSTLTAYEHFAGLREAGRLLPDDDDRLRDALERSARVIDAAAELIPQALASALARRGRDVTLRFGKLVEARLHATRAGDEIWVAIATQAADGRFVDDRLRDVLFRLVFDAAEAELWEPRADWPSGELAWFEVARLGLREPD
jgi:phytoene dehydrogenase-like protein